MSTIQQLPPRLETIPEESASRSENRDSSQGVDQPTMTTEQASNIHIIVEDTATPQQVGRSAQGSSHFSFQESNPAQEQSPVMSNDIHNVTSDSNPITQGMSSMHDIDGDDDDDIDPAPPAAPHVSSPSTARNQSFPSQIRDTSSRVGNNLNVSGITSVTSHRSVTSLLGLLGGVSALFSFLSSGNHGSLDVSSYVTSAPASMGSFVASVASSVSPSSRASTFIASMSSFLILAIQFRNALRRDTEGASVLHLLQVFGLTRQEATDVQSFLHLTNVDTLASTPSISFAAALTQLNIHQARTDQLVDGLDAFQIFYRLHDKREVTPSSPVPVLVNSFVPRTYDHAAHRYAIDSLHASPGTSLPTPPSFNLSGVQVSPIAPTAGTTAPIQPPVPPPVPAIVPPVPPPAPTPSPAPPVAPTPVPAPIPPPVPPPTPPPVIIAGVGSTQGSGAPVGGSGLGGGGPPDDPDSSSSSSDPSTPGNTGGDAPNDDGHGPDDDPSDSGSYSSDSSDEDSDDEFPIVSDKTAGSMDNGSKNPLPSLPANKAISKAWFLKAHSEIDSINGSKLIADGDARLLKPVWRGGRKKGSKFRRHKKRVRSWQTLDRSILKYIRNCAFESKHQLRTLLGEYKSGVAAYDFICKQLDPIQTDPLTAQNEAIETYQKLKLTSSDKGSWTRFRTKLHEAISDLHLHSISFAQDDAYMKRDLIGKLTHNKDYNVVYLSKSKYDSMTFAQTLADIESNAMLIERQNSSSSDGRGKSSINNTSTKTGDSSKPIPGTIGNFKVDKNGFINKHAWEKLSKEDRTKYFNAKKKLREEGVVFPKQRSSDNGDDSKKESNLNVTQSEPFKNQQRTISKLQKQIKDMEGGDSNSTADKDTSSSNINNMSYADVLKKLPKEAAEKTQKYIKSKISVMKSIDHIHAHNRTVTFTNHQLHNVSQDEDANYVIIDGGADTSLKGNATSTTLELTHRKVSVSGFSDKDKHQDLSIGVTATKVWNEDKNPIILIEDEQIIYPEQETSVTSVNQIRAMGIDIDDCPQRFTRDGVPGRNNMIVDEHVIPFIFDHNLVLMKASPPTEKELRTLPIVLLISGREWNPSSPPQEPLSVSPTWTPLPEDDLGIVDDKAHSILASRVINNVNIHHIHPSNEESFVERDVEILDELPSHLTAVIALTKTKEISDELTSLASDDKSEDGMPPLVPRDDDSSDDEFTDDEDSHADMPSLASRNDDTSVDSWDFDDDSSIDSADVDDHDFTLSDLDSYRDHVTIDDDLTLTSHATRLVLNTNHIDQLHRDKGIYPAPFHEATSSNVLDYIRHVGNVKGAKGLRPRNKVVPSHLNIEETSKRFGFVSEKIMKDTLGITTQLASMDVRFPQRRHYKARYPHANVRRLHETYSTDTMFGSTTAIGGYTCCQLFVGNESSFTAVYPMKREGEGIQSLEQFVTDYGAPDSIRRDNSKMQNSKAWTDYERKMHIKSETSEPHNQQQNPAERRIQTVKNGTQKIMDRTNAPPFIWLECLIFYVAILNMCCLDRLKGRNAYEVAFGYFILFQFWEPVYYLDS